MRAWGELWDMQLQVFYRSSACPSSAPRSHWSEQKCVSVCECECARVCVFSRVWVSVTSCRHGSWPCYSYTCKDSEGGAGQTCSVCLSVYLCSVNKKKILYLVRLKIALSICTYFYRDRKCFCTQIWISSCLFLLCCPYVNVCFFFEAESEARVWPDLLSNRLIRSWGAGFYFSILKKIKKRSRSVMYFRSFVSDFYVSGVSYRPGEAGSVMWVKL